MRDTNGRYFFHKPTHRKLFAFGKKVNMVYLERLCWGEIHVFSTNDNITAKKKHAAVGIIVVHLFIEFR